MTTATDRVFILFKKTDFNRFLSCLGARCRAIGVGEIIEFLLPKWGRGSKFY